MRSAPRRSAQASVVFVLCGLALASAAGAEPSFARMYKESYGYEPSCNACHSEGGGSPLNAYGEALKKAGVNPGGLKAIEPLDSDGDKSANAVEIKARSNPGSASSTPDNKGNWLDPANLIPVEVQKLFPGIKSYKPIDAILTDREIERARGLGVTLGKEDETTIYVPFDGQKAAGAAIIVPTTYESKPLFLVVAMDRELNLKGFAPIGASKIPPATESKVASSLVGKSARALPAPAHTDSIDDAVTAGVKKAATILYVRLTKE